MKNRSYAPWLEILASRLATDFPLWVITPSIDQTSSDDDTYLVIHVKEKNAKSA